MPVVHAPCLGNHFTLLEDWSVAVEWHKSNLLMLAAYKLTGKTKVRTYGYQYDRTTGRPILDARGDPTPNYRNETVPNKLFLNDDGEYEAALITIPKDTVFKVTKMTIAGLGYDGDETTVQYHFKCISSPKTEIKNRILFMNIHELMDLNCSIQRNKL